MAHPTSFHVLFQEAEELHFPEFTRWNLGISMGFVS
jgi:hypothetical protein